jgi:acyltransferase
LKSERIYWIDTLRAIAIIFVVVGHTPGIQHYEAVVKYIYSFHIPLFFLISGVLFNPKVTESGYVPFLRDQVRALLIPYFAWGLLTYLPWVIISRHHGSYPDLSPLKPLIGLLYGTGSGTWLIHNGALWFLPCLFATRLLFFTAFKTFDRAALPWPIALMALAGFAAPGVIPFPVPWGVDVALVAVGFFATGFVLRDRLLSFPALSLATLGCFLVLSAAGQIASLSANERISMAERAYGNPFLFISAAFLGIAFWFAVAKSVRPSALMTKLGEASILIFVLHTLVFNVVTGFAIFVLKMPPSFRYTSLLVAAVYTLAAVSLIAPAMPVVRRFQPWVIGR